MEDPLEGGFGPGRPTGRHGQKKIGSAVQPRVPSPPQGDGKVFPPAGLISRRNTGIVRHGPGWQVRPPEAQARSGNPPEKKPIQGTMNGGGG